MQGPKNTAITPMPIPRSGTGSLAFYAPYHFRMNPSSSTLATAHSFYALENSKPVVSLRRTLELNCKAPFLPGFVSFNSLFGGLAAPSEKLVTRPWYVGS